MQRLTTLMGALALWGACASAQGLPVSYTPTADEFKTFTVIDANADGCTFYASQDRSEQACMRYKYHDDGNAADDWAILPAFTIADASKVYRFAAQIAADSDSPQLGENISVYLGTAPTAEAMQTTIIGDTLVHSKKYAEYAGTFSVPAAGTYYIGIHCTSRPDMFNLFVRDISVAESSLSPMTPAPPTELMAVPGAKGALTATVSLRLPEAGITGQPLSGTLEATVTCGQASATAQGAPGQTVSVEVPTAQGDNTITATASSADGASEPATVTVFTGIDAPGPVTALRYTNSEDNMAIDFTWEAPGEVGDHGAYCPAGGIDYYLYKYYEGMGWIEEASIGTDVYSYRYTLPDDTPLCVYSYFIVAGNNYGRSETYAGLKAIAGRPFELPFSDQVVPQPFTYGPEKFPFTEMGDTEDYRVSWGFGYPGYLGADFVKEGVEAALIGMNEQAGPTKGLIGLAKVSTASTSTAAFSADMYTGACKNVEILGQTYGQAEPVVVADLSAYQWSPGYNHFTFLLPESLQRRPWVQLFVRVTMQEPNEIFLLTSYGVAEAPAEALDVTLSGPAELALGATGTYTATVYNRGAKPAERPALTFSVLDQRGVQAWSQAVPAGAELAPGASVNVPVDITAAIDFTTSFTVLCTVAGADDLSASLPVHLDASAAAVVSDLCAFSGDHERSIILRWTEPELNSTLEGFESAAPGVALPAALGAFKVIDGDDARCFGNSFYNPDYAKCSWTAIDLTDTSAADPAPRLGGAVALYAVCPGYEEGGAQTEPQAASDWLISPAVEPGSAISFQARACYAKYGTETIEVLASRATDDPADFTLVKSIDVPTEEWAQYTAQLPAETRYFALRYVSVDKFGLLLDAVRYVPQGAGAVPVSYRVERNGATVHAAAPAGGQYEDLVTPAKDVTYTYRITPTMSDGTTGLPSNAAVYSLSGIDAPALEGADGFDPALPVELYDLQGRRLSQAPASGFYIERQGALARKRAAR